LVLDSWLLALGSWLYIQKKMNKILSLLLILLSLSSIKAVELDSARRDPAYVKTIVERSSKITDKLEINSASDKQAVTILLANRYFQLNDIYERRDSLLQALKADNTIDKAEREKKNKSIQDEKDAALYRTHFAFPAALSLYLTDDQIVAVKDGMTFGVVKVTYDSTLDMIPSLKEEEKAQILAWLIEAREYAMDAESSNKKHEVFGKYKGRINNYLSKRGYNLVKEREEWYKRIKEREKK
jgi:hypothetical protein